MQLSERESERQRMMIGSKKAPPPDPLAKQFTPRQPLVGDQLYAHEGVVVTPTWLILAGQRVPVEQVESVTDSTFRTGVGWARRSAGVLLIFVPLLFIASVMEEQRVMSQVLFFGFWAVAIASVITGIVLCVQSVKGVSTRWRVMLNRPFAQRTNVDFGTIADAQDFLGALTKAKGGRLEYLRPQGTSWYVGISVPLG